MTSCPKCGSTTLLMAYAEGVSVQKCNDCGEVCGKESVFVHGVNRMIACHLRDILSLALRRRRLEAWRRLLEFCAWAEIGPPEED